MIADSGAFFSMLSPAGAASLHLDAAPLPFGVTFSGVGGEFSASVARVKAFTLTNSILPDVDFVVGGSDIETPAVGLIGQNLLGIGDVDYDIADGAIRLIMPKGCAHADLAYWGGGKPYAVIPIESRNGVRNHTIGAVLVNGVRVRATFDTGAPNTILSLRSAARAGVSPVVPGCCRPARPADLVATALRPGSRRSRPFRSVTRRYPTPKCSSVTWGWIRRCS